MKRYFPELLVFFQLLFIALVLVTGPMFSRFNFWLLLEITGIILVSWAFFEIRWGNINVRPIVKENGVLVTSGPYQLIRHPMYTATLMVMTALIGEYFSFLRLAFIIALVIILILKINYEEKDLIEHYADYPDYIKRSKRLIPYIY